LFAWPFFRARIMDGRSETSDYIGPGRKPALQPGSDQSFNELPGEGYEQKEGEQIGEKAGGEEEHPSNQDHGPVHELCGGEPSLGQFRLDVAHGLETLGPDQPGPRKADDEEEKDSRQRTDNLARLDDEVYLDNRDYGEEDEEADEHLRAFR